MTPLPEGMPAPEQMGPRHDLLTRFVNFIRPKAEQAGKIAQDTGEQFSANAKDAGKFVFETTKAMFSDPKLKDINKAQTERSARVLGLTALAVAQITPAKPAADAAELSSWTIKATEAAAAIRTAARARSGLKEGPEGTTKKNETNPDVKQAEANRAKVKQEETNRKSDKQGETPLDAAMKMIPDIYPDVPKNLMPVLGLVGLTGIPAPELWQISADVINQARSYVDQGKEMGKVAWENYRKIRDSRMDQIDQARDAFKNPAGNMAMAGGLA